MLDVVMSGKVAAAIIICLMMTTFSVMLMILIFLPFYEYILTTLEDFFTYSLFVSRKAGGFPLLLLSSRPLGILWNERGPTPEIWNFGSST